MDWGHSSANEDIRFSVILKSLYDDKSLGKHLGLMTFIILIQLILSEIY